MNVKYDFTGKNVVVTGAAKGLGKAIATTFAQAGAGVVIADFDEVTGKKTAEEMKAQGYNAIFCKVDVSDEASVVAMKDEAVAHFGQIDVLVNNAGIGTKLPGLPYTDIPSSEYKKLYNVNTMGVVHCCGAFYGHFMARKSGKIVNIASIAGINNSPILPQYNMSKAAIISLSRSLAQEMGAYNINVNVVNPGFVLTDIYTEGGADSNAQNMKRKLPQLLGDCQTDAEIINRLGSYNSNLHRPQTPENIADAVIFLASDGAECISGQCINVDSGIIRW